ncbi:MAG TPA: hypothetical protein VJB90_06330 [Candidatus Nanoarchaeia archaeon]|nr:hypothetical protein [Candidatus Nanoarchaeia archaeon]
MGLAEEAFSELFEGVESYEFLINYSGRLKGYNGIVRKGGNNISFSLSKNWRGVDRQIQKGMLQHLLLKILGKKGHTGNIDLYTYFIKSLHMASAKTSEDELLTQSCEKVIEQMQLFDVEKPCLAWGNATFRKLASYNYETDAIIISSLFQNAPQELIDYLMYHELLHKKFKFKQGGSRTLHHSAEFKRWERKFPNSEELEKQLSHYVRKKRGIMRLFW